jgi:NAD-dependent dihydropyrimidine dehydrogenase PreA subunit
MDRSCLEECPVDCVYEGDRKLYIHPDECIDRGACEPVCPQDAITPEVTATGGPCTARPGQPRLLLRDAARPPGTPGAGGRRREGGPGGVDTPPRGRGAPERRVSRRGPGVIAGRPPCPRGEERHVAGRASDPDDADVAVQERGEGGQVRDV